MGKYTHRAVAMACGIRDMKRYWLETLLILATTAAMTATMCGCAGNRKQMNKLFFDLGKATGKVEAMGYGR